MAKKPNSGPSEPSRITVKRAREQRSVKETDGWQATPMESAREAFRTASQAQASMSVIDERPSVKKNAGTQQYRKNRGRQGSI